MSTILTKWTTIGAYSWRSVVKSYRFSKIQYCWKRNSIFNKINTIFPTTPLQCCRTTYGKLSGMVEWRKCSRHKTACTAENIPTVELTVSHESLQTLRSVRQITREIGIVQASVFWNLHQPQRPWSDVFENATRASARAEQIESRAQGHPTATRQNAATMYERRTKWTSRG